MQLNRCPTCHSRISLEQVVQDEAGRELLGVIAGLDTSMGAALVTYIGLFRSAKRDLANDRALRLMREAMELTTNRGALQAALVQTVEQMRHKQASGGFKPLTNHNYLKQVLQDKEGEGYYPATPEPTQQQPRTYNSKAARGLAALESMKIEEN